MMLMVAGGLMTLLVGCGDDDPCANVQCDFGVCQDGACRNPSSCTSDLNCLPGYNCGDQGVCQALTSCSVNGDCASNWCRDGVCANPETCETNDDCFERTYCADDNTCRPDPCNTFQCQRGQCARGTVTCESKESCTLETEDVDCVEGERCLEGSCYAPEDYNEALACERGVGSFEERACVNADDCGGDSNNCLNGYYCNDANECVEDLCRVNNVECTDGGVCVPSLGECENANPCASDDECLTGHWCVEGTCRLEEVACGDAGCPGNQLCVRSEDPEDLTVTCVENTSEGCTTSLDCADDRQCGGSACLEPFACNDDAFEPNDTEAEATNLNEVAIGIAAHGSICSGDTDFYTVDLSQYEGMPLRGTLMVTVDYATRDAGLGELELTVLDPQGNVVDTDTAGDLGKDGMAQVTKTLNAAASRQYTIKVTAADGADLSSAGIEYTVSADLLDPESLNACSNAMELTAGTPVRGDTTEPYPNDDPKGYHLGSSCTSVHNEAREDLYFFELTEPSRVTLNVLPDDSSKDFSLALRRDCERIETEEACVDAGTSGGELLQTILGPGTYYVVVQAASSSSTGGSYRLTLSADSRTCAPSTNACTDSSTAQICADDGSQAVSTSCTLGCDPQTGTCERYDGDVCTNPIRLANGDTETISWGDYKNDYDMQYSSCFENSVGSQTNGPDAVYAVRVQPNYGLQASLEFDQGDSGAVYILDNCVSATSSCVDGGNANNGNVETAIYLNDTGVTQTVFVVADSQQTSTLGQATLSVEVNQRVCTPRTTRCDGSGNVERCNEIGTGYVPEEQCFFGCVAGACDMSCDPATDQSFCVDADTEMVCTSSDSWQENDCAGGCSGTGCTLESCTNPADVTSAAKQPGGSVITGLWGDFAADLRGSGCGVSTGFTEGEDIVLTATLADTETISVTHDQPNNTGIYNADPAVAIMSSCGDISSSTCLAGDTAGDGPATASYTNNTGASQTVFILIDSDDSNSSSRAETFEVVTTIQ